ncbi:MAG: DUF2339 domain-containing protein, partial [Planctomycetota bacterium]
FRGPVWPTALLLGLLAAAAIVVGRVQQVPWLSLGAAAGAVAVVGVWLFTTDLSAPRALWELAAVAIGLALVSHAGAEWERRAGRSTGPPRLALAASGATGSWFLLAILAAGEATQAPLWPLLVLWIALSLFLARQAWLAGTSLPLRGAAIGLALGLAVYRATHFGRVGVPVPDPRVYLAIVVVLGLALLLGGLAARGERGRALLQGLGLFLAVQVVDLSNTTFYHAHDPWLLPVTALAFGALLAAAAVRLASGVIGIGAVAVPCFLAWRWTGEFAARFPAVDAHRAGLLLVLAIATLAGGWPAAVPAGRRGRPWTWRAGALAAPVLLGPVETLWTGSFGRDLSLAPPLLAGLLALSFVAPLAARAARTGIGAWRVPLAWYGGAALVLLSRVAPEAIAVEEEVVAAALGAALLALLARRLAHPGLAWVASSATAGVALVLAIHALDFGHYERSAVPVASWIGYAHLVPAACAVVVLGAGRAVPDPRAFRSLLPGLGALVAFFLALNLEILGHFATGARVDLDLERLPARDVTMSIAWGAYALVLLVLGIWRRAGALRWSSLALFFLALAKVFLYDLGHLGGLYRVASLAGLAVALLAVSLFYQRFGFRRPWNTVP